MREDTWRISAWYKEGRTTYFIFNREIDYLPMFASKKSHSIDVNGNCNMGCC